MKSKFAFKKAPKIKRSVKEEKGSNIKHSPKKPVKTGMFKGRYT
jgi:hypothetical protein